MFPSTQKTHFSNVNAMLGFRFEATARAALCVPESEEESREVEAEFYPEKPEEAK